MEKDEKSIKKKRNAWLSVAYVSSTCVTPFWVQVNTHGTEGPLRGEAVGGQNGNRR